MAIPHRYNPVNCQYKRFLPGSTRVDDDWGEPKVGAEKQYSDPIDIVAQIAWTNKERRERAVTGDPSNSDGHLCLKRAVVLSNGWVFAKGDIITSIADFPVNLTIIEVRPSGHLRGKANLLMLYFKENEETNPVLRR